MTNFLSSATHLRAYLNERQFFLDELELNRDNYDCNLYSVCEAFLKKHKESHKEYLSQEASEKRDLYVTTGTHSVLRTVRYVLEQPQETLIGTIVLTITNLVNLLAVVTALIETFPQLNLHVHPEKRKVFFHIEIFLTAFFGLELLLRFVTARDHLRFFLQINSVIDIVAVVPLFVALITNARKTELRTLRLVRVLKMSRDTLGMQVLLRTLRASFQALVGPGLLLTFCVLVMGTFVYFAEHGEYDPNVGSFLIMNCTCESENIGASMECKKIPATFVSIPHAMWWALVTWANIGYGDVVPICPVAKTLGTVTAASGTVFLSFPVVIIGTYLYHITQSSSRERERVTITRRGGTKRTTAGSNNRMLSVEDAVSPGELLMQYVTERLHVLEKRGAIECISNQPPPKSLVHVIEEYCSVSCPECKEGECNLPDERVLPDSVNRRRVTIEDPKNKSFLVLELVGVKQAGKRVGASRIIAPNVIELPISEFEWHVGTPSTDVPDADILLPCDCDGAQTRHAVFSYNFHSRALTVRPFPCVTYQTEDEKSLRGKNNLTTYVSVNNQMVPASGTKVKAGDKIGFSNNALHEELFKVERRAMMDISEVLST